MRVIIVGCGKLGSGLAKALTRKGNQVTIIDSNADAFELLDKDFRVKLLLELVLTGIFWKKPISAMRMLLLPAVRVMKSML